MEKDEKRGRVKSFLMTCFNIYSTWIAIVLMEISPMVLLFCFVVTLEHFSRI